MLKRVLISAYRIEGLTCRSEKIKAHNKARWHRFKFEEIGSSAFYSGEGSGECNHYGIQPAFTEL